MSSRIYSKENLDMPIKSNSPSLLLVQDTKISIISENQIVSQLSIHHSFTCRVIQNVLCLTYLTTTDNSCYKIIIGYDLSSNTFQKIYKWQFNYYFFEGTCGFKTMFRKNNNFWYIDPKNGNKSIYNFDDCNDIETIGSEYKNVQMLTTEDNCILYYQLQSDILKHGKDNRIFYVIDPLLYYPKKYMTMNEIKKIAIRVILPSIYQTLGDDHENILNPFIDMTFLKERISTTLVSYNYHLLESIDSSDYCIQIWSWNRHVQKFIPGCITSNDVSSTSLMTFSQNEKFIYWNKCQFNRIIGIGGTHDIMANYINLCSQNSLIYCRYKDHYFSVDLQSGISITYKVNKTDNSEYVYFNESYSVMVHNKLGIVSVYFQNKPILNHFLIMMESKQNYIFKIPNLKDS
jgi:hypothetical protein